jgi:hypothetical protein
MNECFALFRPVSPQRAMTRVSAKKAATIRVPESAATTVSGSGQQTCWSMEKKKTEQLTGINLQNELIKGWIDTNDVANLMM